MEIDLNHPMNFQRSVETVAAALNIALVRLREQVSFDEHDELNDPLPAAHLLLAMLEDATREVNELVDQLET